MAAEPAPSFGALLRSLRLAAGLTQEALAERAGLSVRGVSNLERGARRAPHPHTVRQLARALRLAPAERARLLAALPPRRGLAARPAAVLPPTNLPVPVTSFVGRERELAEVKELLGRTRLLTLTGTGGVGKTRLALQIAADLAKAYPDGVWFIDLAPLADPALIPGAALAAFGVSDVPGQAPLATLLAHLQGRAALLVLDNCEHLIDAAAQMADALIRRCPSVHLLATSREALGIPGESAWRVPSRAIPAAGAPPTVVRVLATEAGQLFLDRARAVQPAFGVTAANAPAIAQVCARLDGIPLALELAASRVRVLTVEQIAARLDDRFRLLTGGRRTGLRRQQTLQGAIDWSYDLLTKLDRIAFQRLAVFVGGWTLAAAEAVCAGGGIKDWEVLDRLTSLVDKSLVVAEAQGAEERYRLLETIRQYAEEKVLASGEVAAVRDRHRDCYLALAEQAAAHIRQRPDEVDAWLARLDLENDNLRAALAWSVERDPTAGLRLAVSLRLFWWHRRRHLEGVQWLETLLARAPGEGRLQVWARASIGFLAREYGDFERARAPLTEALARFQALDDREGRALALASLGLLHAGEGRLAEAQRCQEQSLALYQAVGDTAQVAHVLNHLGLLATQAGDFAAASRRHEESLALARREGYRPRIARQLYLLGSMVRLLGDHERARRLFAEATDLMRSGDPFLWAGQWTYPADLATDEGAYEQAGGLYRLALRHYQQVGWPPGISHMAQRLGILAIRTGKARRGVRLVAATHAIGEGILCVHMPELPHERAAALEQARAALGATAFQAAWAAGQALPLEQAAAEALAEEGAAN